MMINAGGWNLVESNPDTYTELIKGFGCKGARVEELWTLSPEQFDDIRPVHGITFLYQWELSRAKNDPAEIDNTNKIFFARQVINNGCATQAALSIILNISHPDIVLGSKLEEFKSFCGGLNATARGLALSNSHALRSIHNSLAMPPIPKTEFQVPPTNNYVFHFISYVPINGHLYELNGLKEGPINHGVIPENSDWITLARPLIERYINRYRDKEIPFNVMAVITDKEFKYKERITEVESQLQYCACKMVGSITLTLPSDTQVQGIKFLTLASSTGRILASSKLKGSLSGFSHKTQAEVPGHKFMSICMQVYKKKH